MKRTLLAVLFLVLGALPASGGGPQCQPVPQPKPQPGGQFGCSVNLHNGTLAVGAHLDGPGSVTLCPQGATETKDCHKILPADGHPGDEFGRSVAVDKNWIIVGSPFANGSGAVYIYDRDLTLHQKLTVSDGSRGDQFGATLALSNDTLIVGALNNAGTTGSLSGAVYVFHWDGHTWALSQKLTAGDARPFDNFGFSLAVDGNVVVIGAPFHEGTGANSGEAYVFEWNGKTWSQTARLTASDAAAGDEYGSAVAVSGNFLAVGARADDMNGMQDAGSAYVYERSGSSWRDAAHLFGQAAGDRFGVAVSMDGDQLLIGALLHNGNGQPESGAAYLYQRLAGTWVQSGAPILGTAAGDRFGQAVSIDRGDLLVGAYLGDTDAKDAGYAKVCPASPSTADLSLTKTGPTSAKPGDTITYTLTVNNSGPDKATGFHLEDPIPAGLQPIPKLIPEYCRITGGMIACDRLVDLDVGKPQLVPLGFTVLETCATAIVNRHAAVSGKEPDPNQDNNEAPPVSTAVVRTADLKISKTGPASVRSGDPVPYTLTVTNLGPGLACGVAVSDPIPAHLGSPVLPAGCSLTGNEVRCSVPQLSAGASSSFQVSFRALAAPCGSTIVNTATVSAAPPAADPVSGNNSAMASTAFATDLSITKRADRDIAQPGQTLRYTIKVENPDGCRATVRDFFPGALTNVQWCKEQGGPCAPSTPGNLYDVVTGPATYDVQGTVSPVFTGTLVNTATVEGPAEVIDVDPGNNLSSYPAEIFVSPDIPTLTEPWLATLALLLALLALRRLRLPAL
jgi:uncharacterized repeat protein (TIGR01451 family)